MPGLYWVDGMVGFRFHLCFILNFDYFFGLSLGTTTLLCSFRHAASLLAISLKNKLRISASKLLYIGSAPKQAYFDRHRVSNHVQSCYRILDPNVSNMCKKVDLQIKGFALTIDRCRGNLQHMQVSQLTIQHPVVAVMGCQSFVYVMYSMCNVLGNQLVFLKIETHLYLRFKWSIHEIQYNF